MRFRLLGNQATLEGMSGGLAIDHNRGFAGLIYGRRLDQFNLVIPADAVLHVRERAARPQGPLDDPGRPAVPTAEPL